MSAMLISFFAYTSLLFLATFLVQTNIHTMSFFFCLIKFTQKTAIIFSYNANALNILMYFKKIKGFGKYNPKSLVMFNISYQSYP